MNNVSLNCPAGFNSLCNITPTSAVQGIINFFLIVALLVAFFWLVLGGIRWITSGGDKNNVQVAREQVTQAIIGLVIVLAAWLILNVIGTLFGISISNWNILPLTNR
jgi:hypothetical protein